MRRHDLSPRMLLIVAVALVLLWLDSCDDLSWLPNAPYDYNS